MVAPQEVEYTMRRDLQIRHVPDYPEQARAGRYIQTAQLAEVLFVCIVCRRAYRGLLRVGRDRICMRFHLP
mgnify:CR=1 FL=1